VSLSTESLARACARHPWRTVGLWVAVVVLSMGIVAVLLGDTLTTEGEVTSPTDSKRAEELLFEHFPPSPDSLEQATSEVVVVSFSDGAVDQERVQAFARELRKLGATSAVTSADESWEKLNSAHAAATAVLVGISQSEESLTDAIQTL
jgi:uncharacterized membrane protein YdfJ with MMPL/SSD domain